MTDPLPETRDPSGRFVKPRETPQGAQISEMQPMARILFGWTRAKAAPNIALGAALLLGAGLILASYTLDQTGRAVAGVPIGYFAVIGFATAVLVGLAAWPLGQLLRRGEGYYGEGPTEPNQDAAGEGS